MKKNIYALWVFLLMITVSAFAARVLDVDQIKSSDRTKLWTLPTTGLIASSGTLEVSNGTSTLTNKSISLGANTLTSTSAQLSTALSDETGSGSAVFGTGPTIASPLIGTIVNTGTLTLPTSTDTLVGRATTDTLTNKTVSGGTISGADIDGGTASNTSRLTLPKAAKTTLDALTRKQGTVMYDTTSGKPYYDTGSVLKPVGSGAGGEKNYLTDYNNNTGNGDIELGATTGWALGHGAVDSTTKMLTTATFGSGASGNLSIGTVGGSSALAGSYSLHYTSSAATTAGDFLASDAFTIDPEDKAKPLRFQFNYIVASGGTFATWSGSTTNSFQVALYDVTNSQLIQPSGNASMTTSSGSLSGMGYGEFQTSASGTQYRLIVYNANATTGAIQLNFDSFKVGLNPKVYGSPTGDATTVTMTLANAGNATISGKESRRGDKALYEGLITIGATPPTGTIGIVLPGGRSIDTTKLSDTTTFLAAINGQAIGNDAGTAIKLYPVYQSSTTIALEYQSTTTSALVVNSTQPVTWASGDKISFSFEVPITGWSSSVQMSDSADTRVVAARYIGTTSVAPASLTPAIIIMNTKVIDKQSAYNTSTGLYTVQVPGTYQVTFQTHSAVTAEGVNRAFDITIYKNGSSIASRYVTAYTTTNVEHTPSITALVECIAGDTLAAYIGQNLIAASTLTLSNNNRTYIDIQRLSGPSQIAASETVAARYTHSSGQSLTSTGVIDFANKTFDSHNAVTTGASWKFTAPISGIYFVSYNLLSTSATTEWNTSLAKGGSALTTDAALPLFNTGTSIFNNRGMVRAGTSVKLLAGEYIDVRISFAASVGALSASGSVNYIDIIRVGNY